VLERLGFVPACRGSAVTGFHIAATHMMQGTKDYAEFRAMADIAGHSPEMLLKVYCAHDADGHSGRGVTRRRCPTRVSIPGGHDATDWSIQLPRTRLTCTVEESAALLGLARSTMYELVRSGDVTSIRLGRRILVTRPTLEALLGFEPPSPSEMVGEVAEIVP
jgi:excisionase family DNA binding protein